MAGKLTISTLNDSSGVLATQNGMTGVGKAWAKINATSGSLVLDGSFNVSSVTLVTTGVIQVNFTTAMTNANYAISGSTSNNASSRATYPMSPDTTSTGGGFTTGYCTVLTGLNTSLFTGWYTSVVINGA